MKKIFVLFLLVFLIFSVVSCNGEITKHQDKPDELVSVIFRPVIPQAKSISGQIDSSDLAVAKYQYQAAPASKNSIMKGSTADQWIDLVEKEDTGIYETDCCFSVGQWEFKLRALNSKNGQVYEGQSESVVLLSSGPNAVTIDLEEKPDSVTTSKGTVDVSVKVPQLISGGEEGTFTVNFYNLSYEAASSEVKTALSGSANEDGTYTFTGSYNLLPGNYLIKVSYSETNEEGTAQLCSSIAALRVIENTTTSVTGNVEESLYVSASITVNEAKKIAGTLSVQKSDKKYVCTFTPSSGDTYLTPDTYAWYVDGEKVLCSTAAYTYEPGTSYGYHSVTCVASKGSAVISKTESVNVTK